MNKAKLFVFFSWAGSVLETILLDTLSFLLFPAGFLLEERENKGNHWHFLAWISREVTAGNSSECMVSGAFFYKSCDRIFYVTIDKSVSKVETIMAQRLVGLKCKRVSFALGQSIRPDLCTQWLLGGNFYLALCGLA